MRSTRLLAKIALLHGRVIFTLTGNVSNHSDNGSVNVTQF